jgi:hypothetical protein
LANELIGSIARTETVLGPYDNIICGVNSSAAFNTYYFIAARRRLWNSKRASLSPNNTSSRLGGLLD